MAVKIRQELNILDAILSAAGGASATSNAIVQLDTTQYVNPTYYFEIVGDSSISISFNVTLRRKGTSTDDATCNIPLLTTAYKRVRSSSFTPPAGQTEYVVFIDATAGATKNVKSARIIVIDNPTTLTSSETQIEIGNQETGLISLTAAPLTNPKYWKYTAANWDGTKTFYAEVTYLMAASKNGGTFTLQEDNGSFASWADKVTIVSAGVQTSATRVRSAAFTPTDGRNYRIAYLVSGTKTAASIYNAKIIVDQTGDVSTDTYYFNASTSGPTDSGAEWTNDANAFDGSTATSASSTTNGDYLSEGGTKDLVGEGTTASASNTTIIKSVRARVYGKTSNAASIYNIQVYDGTTILSSGLQYVNTVAAYQSYFTVTAPSGGWTWAKLSTLKVRFNRSTISGHIEDVYRAEIEVTSNSSTTGLPTKLEPQYLLLNTADTGGTINQDYDTLWDSSEWSGLTNTYKHAMDSDNASNSADLVDIDNSDTQVTNSSVTGANQQISAALTMPTTGHQIDTDIDNTTGVVSASRILVATVISSAASASITQVAGSVTAAGGTQAVVGIIVASTTVTQLAGSITATGGTQAITANVLTNASVAQVAGVLTATGGTQVIATIQNVAISQIAGVVTASGGTQIVEAITVTNASVTQLAATVTASGGTQAVATVNSASITQSAASVTATGGTQVIATVNNASLAQLAANVTASGGTQVIDATNNISVTQLAANVTTTGGAQTIDTSSVVNAEIIQLAGNVTAAGGTQSIATVNNVSLVQLAAVITSSGGTQSIDTVNIVAIAQIAASVAATGGVQTIETGAIVNASITQVAASVTATGGIQAVDSMQYAAITQLAANVTAIEGTQVIDSVQNVFISQNGVTTTASGGTQSIDTTNNASITQIGTNIATTGGTQIVVAQISVAVLQLAANVTASGGLQDIYADSGAMSASITQLAAAVTSTGGTQIVSTSTGPLPSTRKSVILLTDGKLAVRLGNNLYMPL